MIHSASCLRGEEHELEAVEDVVVLLKLQLVCGGEDALEEHKVQGLDCEGVVVDLGQEVDQILGFVTIEGGGN